MYNLTVGGQRVRDLRLSATTLSKIFTGAITRWSDPAITADYGKPLPDIPVIPVVRSDGAGASAQFTKYMASQAPSIYCPFIQGKLHLSSGCPSVSFYPAFGSSKAQVGSNGVANYVSASYGAGSIGYVEYAYAKRINFPVIGLLNKAGYFAQPTAGNVAVALTKAALNPDLTQNLESVYTNPDPRAYPMSSYSYMVIPTSTDAPFNTDKGKTLSTFINYFLCQGQQKADILGYSPLPKNLVLAGFEQSQRIPGAVAPPAIESCNNPALDILNSAPQPDPCTKQGATCGATTTTTGGGGKGNGGGNNSGGGAGGNTDATDGGTAPATTPDSTGAPVAVDPLGGAAAPTASDPLAGGAGVVDPAVTDVSAQQGAAVPGAVVQLTGGRSGQNLAAAWIGAVALILTVLTPPFLLQRHRRGR